MGIQKLSLVVGMSLAALLSAAGCIEHRVKSDPVEIKPIKVEPIHITVDVNVRVDRQLDEFFQFEDTVK